TCALPISKSRIVRTKSPKRASTRPAIFRHPSTNWPGWVNGFRGGRFRGSTLRSQGRSRGKPHTPAQREYILFATVTHVVCERFALFECKVTIGRKTDIRRYLRPNGAQFIENLFQPILLFKSS